MEETVDTEKIIAAIFAATASKGHTDFGLYMQNYEEFMKRIQERAQKVPSLYPQKSSARL